MVKVNLHALSDTVSTNVGFLIPLTKFIHLFRLI